MANDSEDVIKKVRYILREDRNTTARTIVYSLLASMATVLLGISIPTLPSQIQLLKEQQLQSVDFQRKDLADQIAILAHRIDKVTDPDDKLNLQVDQTIKKRALNSLDRNSAQEAATNTLNLIKAVGTTGGSVLLELGALIVSVSFFSIWEMHMGKQMEVIASGIYRAVTEKNDKDKLSLGQLLDTISLGNPRLFTSERKSRIVLLFASIAEDTPSSKI